MINKSDSLCVVVRFCYDLYDNRPNWTPLSPITITYQGFIKFLSSNCVNISTCRLNRLSSCYYFLALKRSPTQLVSKSFCRCRLSDLISSPNQKLKIIFWPLTRQQTQESCGDWNNIIYGGSVCCYTVRPSTS